MAPQFVVCDTPAVLARVPLRPAQTDAGTPQDGLLAEAMFLASRQATVIASARPAMARPADSCVPSRGEVTRRAYELRSRWRSTPHGAFAGVATARAAGAGEPAGLLVGPGHRARTNPSGAWLTELGDVLLADPVVVGPLRLTASNLVVRRGGRLEHQWRTRRVTARVTEASQLIMDICTGGAVGSEVASEVMRRWPVPDAVVRAALVELVRGGFLLTDLLPADITDDPLGHLLGKIGRDHALTVPLARLRRLLADADDYPVGDPARLQTLTVARDLADSICFVDRPLSLDVAVDARLVVPASLLDEAARAATALWWATGQPVALADWHQRFVTRYGPGRLVPLLEATDAAIGLGLDTHGIEPPERPTGLTARAAGEAAGEVAQDPEPRHAVLATLIADALSHGRTEVVLDEATLTRLAGGPGSPPVCSAEIGVRVIASNRQDLAAGRLRLAVVPPGPQLAGATIGRFAHLLPGAWPGPPADTDTAGTALTVEIAAAACVPEAAALASPTGFTGCRIPVGVPGRPGDLDLADLHLISDGRRLSCWSARRDRQVIPVLYSRLAPALLPPLARFLQLLGHRAAPRLSPWSWGTFASAPFQPRVRYRSTIIVPARWVLPPSLTETAGDAARWGSKLDAWRKTAWPQPLELVVTDDGDHRLPLDLRRDDDRELLRRYVRRGLSAVCEPPGGADAVQAVACGPNGLHVLELVVPLQPRSRSAHAAARPLHPPRTGGEGLFLPGGPWLSIFVCGPRTCQDEILAQLEMINHGLAGHHDLCFWLRYADPAHGPHLRVRYHGDPAALGGVVLPALSQWCADLRRQRLAGGFSIQPYDQEIERYGGPDAIAAAERVFAADSLLTHALLARITDPDQRVAAAARSAAAITTAIADGDPAALDSHRLDRPARRRYETLRPQVRAAGRPHNAATLPDAVPGDGAAEAWEARYTTLTAYRAALKPTQRASCAAALAHMHANRLLGDAVAERIATALAADLLARGQTLAPAT